MGLAPVELSVFGIEGQRLQAEAAQIAARRFKAVVPTYKALARVATNKVDRVIDLLFCATPADVEAIFGLHACEYSSHELSEDDERSRVREARGKGPGGVRK